MIFIKRVQEAAKIYNLMNKATMETIIAGINPEYPDIRRFF